MKPLKILFVEDEEEDFFLTQLAFQRNHDAVVLHRVKDGQEAIDFLRQANGGPSRKPEPLPDVCIVDLKVPRQNGFEVLKWIRSEPALKRLIVLVLSASESSRDINRAYELGANSYLVKPVDLDDFIAMIFTLTRYWFSYCAKPSVACNPERIS